MHIAPAQQIDKALFQASAEKLPVLVVDDKPENLHAFQAILEKQKYTVVCVNSGMEALRYLMKNHVGLILLDVQMPELNGFETAGLIRLKEHLRDIPILFISATMNTDEFVMRGFATGASDYLTKPIDSNILMHKVQVFYQLHQQNKLLQQRNNIIEDNNQNLRNDAEQAELQRTALINQINEILSPTVSLVQDKSTSLAAQVETPEQIALVEELVLASKYLGYLSAELNENLHPEQTTDVHAQNFNLIELVNELVSIFKLIHNHDELDCVIANNVTKHRMVTGKPKLLSRLLYNIITNALFNSLDNAATITVTKYPTQDTYEFKISHHLSPDVDGQGLFLYACQSLSEQIEGSLAIAADDKHTVTVSVELPSA